jgi:hypothetical protein
MFRNYAGALAVFTPLLASNKKKGFTKRVLVTARARSHIELVAGALLKCACMAVDVTRLPRLSARDTSERQTLALLQDTLSQAPP